MASRLNASGLVIAGLGFLLTRFTVTLTIYEDPVRFLLAGVVPLVLGLGLAAFGVALAVADVEPAVVRTTAAWCVAGVGATFVLAVLTLLGTTAGAMPLLATARSQPYLSNFLIGGGVGGTLTGLYAARHRRQRLELRHQTNRLVVLNRLLRHEVLNALTVIRGYASLGDGDADTRAVIESHAADVERTIDEVKYLTRSRRTSGGDRHPIDLVACLEAAGERVRAAHPDATIDLPATAPRVVANDRLELVFAHLLENAVVHAPDDDPAVEVRVEPTPTSIRIGVHDGGQGLPERQRTLLETGEIERYDDPATGFGLNVVRLFVEHLRGDIDTEVTDDGTTITVVLPRERDEAPGLRASHAGLTPVRPAAPHLVVTLGAALVAGVAYGVVSELLGGSIAGIGVFYGTADPLVGWITHEFHSVVFGFVFVALVSLVPAPHRDRLGVHVAVGLAWAVALWLVAAGLVAPIWLRLLGIPASIPNISGVLLLTHLTWGASLGVLTALGEEHVTPRLDRVVDRVTGRYGPA